MAIQYAEFELRFLAALTALGDYGGIGALADVSRQHRYSNGTTASKGNTLFHDVRTLGNGANEDLDLTTLTDGNGAALSTAEIVVLIISAASANTAAIWVGPGAANGWTALLGGTTPVIKINAGQVVAVQMTADPGLAVGATTKVVNFENKAAGASGVYTLTILARNA